MLRYTQDELLELTVFDVNPQATPERWAMLWDTLRTSKKFTVESIHRRKDGSEFPVEIASTYFKYGGKEYVNGFARDISMRKRTEEELQKAQQIESLGLLAGGIAHDFNNLMGGIYGYIEIASGSSSEANVKQNLAMVIQTIDRARGLTRQLLTFAKGGSPIQEVSPLFPLIQQTAQFALSGSNISCRFEIIDDLWLVNVDKNQICQVFENLIINAQQAMPLGGTIVLAARNVAIVENEHPLLKKGDYVRISIIDTGIGIPKELQKRVFDPFFTTKPKGHGLGLATSYSIIKRHGGCIDIESESGKGSTFMVYLPAITGTVPGARVEKLKTHKGYGTFLIMDDELVMREAIGAMLNMLGYSIVSKEDGVKAIEYFKENRNIAGMMFDLTVPGGMGGKEALVAIREIDDDVPVFVASGYADDPVIKDPAAYGFTASICKPFLLSELVEMLEKHMKRHE